MRTPLFNVSLAVMAGGVAGTTHALADGVQIIGHRGNSLFAPENTCISLSSAADKADYVEFDVYSSSDGQLVVIHDATVDRTTDGTGPVSAKTLAELKALDAGSWFSPSFAGEPIPTLAEAIQAILPSATPLIERKGGTAQQYVDALRVLNVTSNVVLQSFNSAFLQAVHLLDPDIALCALGGGALTSSMVASMLDRGATTIGWRHSSITTSEVALVHSFGMKLLVWTVNGYAIRDEIDKGVDGIISDDPGLVRIFASQSPSSGEGLASELVSYWKLDDGESDQATTTAWDVEADNPGFLNGFTSPPSWISGATAKFGHALSFDGTNDCVRIQRSEGLDINTNEVSISLWVKIPAAPSALPGSFASIYDSVQDAYVLYLDRANDELRFKVTNANGDSARPGIPASQLTTGRWHHVVGVFNGGTGPLSGRAYIYLDGSLVDIHTGPDGDGLLGLGGDVQPGQFAAIGCNGTSNESWLAGSVDDVAIWRRVLSSAEVRQIFTAGAHDIALQEQIIAMAVSDLTASPETGNLQIKVQIDHGLLSTHDLVLKSAANATGPYAHEPVSGIQDLGSGAFLISTPAHEYAARILRAEIRSND